MVASRMIRRDPFARTELHRIVVHTDAGCSWCGGLRYNPKGGARTLFVYETQSDGGRNSTHKGRFCSISCHDSYHRAGA